MNGRRALADEIKTIARSPGAFCDTLLQRHSSGP
jgi:hypothetical protein